MAGGSRAVLPPRALAAVATGKLLGGASRRLGRGGGTALPGVAADRIDPRLSARLARQLGGGRIVVTGTNGKTTTARMLAGIAAAAGLRPVHNRSGSNLMRGIVTTLLEAVGFDGRIAAAARRAGVFEVDEATLPYAVRPLRPDAIVFTNLFRDQLDRYGEVDSILTLWRRSLAMLGRATTLVLNADDPSVAGLAEAYDGPILYYGIEDTRSGSGEGAEHAADARWCHACGAEYRYAPIYFGHLGIWRCPDCGRQRPRPQIRATEVIGTAQETLQLQIAFPGGHTALEVPLQGLYNAYNAVAAVAGAWAVQFPLAAVQRGLTGFSAAFGRQERAQVQGRDLRVLLCKNPAGTNQALATVLNAAGPIHLLVALNDGTQDGRDISWIWDVDYERLAGRTASIVATGTRARDLALRLTYAGLGGQLHTEPDPNRALQKAVAATPPGRQLFVLPTYTAMMTLRELIATSGGKQPFYVQ